MKKPKEVRENGRKLKKKKQIRTCMCISLLPSYTVVFHHSHKLSSGFSANLSSRHSKVKIQ